MDHVTQDLNKYENQQLEEDLLIEKARNHAHDNIVEYLIEIYGDIDAFIDNENEDNLINFYKTGGADE